jgi:hypothetical protein
MLHPRGASFHATPNVSSGASETAPTTTQSWWSAVAVLCLGWALCFSVLTSCAASINLAAAMISDVSAFQTVPLACQTFAIGIYNLLLPTEFSYVGRRNAYLLGSLFGLVGSLICFAGIEIGSLALLCFGAAFIGIALAHAQNYRFGVTLCVPEASQPVAISWVLAGGVVGAVAGPEYSKHARDLLSTRYAAIFVVNAIVFACLFVLLLTSGPALRGLGKTSTSKPASATAATAAPGADEGDAPSAAAAAAAAAAARPVAAAAPPPPRSLHVVFSQPRCAACTAIASLVYAVMVFLMASVPLAMVGSGYSFNHSSAVVQAHMVSMFLPSLVSGHAVKRWGVLKIEIVGTLIYSSGALAMLLFGGMGGYGASQSLIGLGWNLCFVAATAGLQQSTSADANRVKAKAQALNDCAVFGLSGTASLVSALALRGIGWAGMNAVGLGVGGLMMAVLGLSEALERRGARKEDAGVSLTVT